MTPDELRSALIASQSDHETVYIFHLSDAQVYELACGRCPRDVQKMADTAIDWYAEDQRRAARNQAEAEEKPKRKRRA